MGIKKKKLKRDDHQSETDHKPNKSDNSECLHILIGNQKLTRQLENTSPR